MTDNITADIESIGSKLTSIQIDLNSGFLSGRNKMKSELIKPQIKEIPQER